MTAPFVPDDFDPPRRLDHPAFVLVPLGPEHNASDYAAWTPSMAHIHATPGYENHPWPHPMTLEENLGDLVRHAEDFAARTGFTYTVLAPADPGTDAADVDAPTVIGCVYIYPSKDPAFDAHVRSWVRAADATLDAPLHHAVAAWLAERWPFTRVDYARRAG
jgi:hypothetical protein